MKVYLNPGHDLDYDSGAVNPNTGLRECDVAAEVGERVRQYLNAAGCETRLLQSDNLYYDSDYADTDRKTAVCVDANNWEADVFVSIHCNAANTYARGTEVFCYRRSSAGGRLAGFIQRQIVDSIGTVDRGVKEKPEYIVLKHTDMPAVLVEMAFIDNDDDAWFLTSKMDEFARAIARGITDYECSMQ